MKLRTHYLATAAALAFALSAPAIAEETGPNGPQVSTPAEKAQTETLNTQQKNGSYVDPAVANGAATPSKPVPAEGVAAATAQTSSTETQYQARQDQYQDQKAQYAADMNAYEHQLAAYQWQRRHPETWWHYRYSRARYITAYVLDRPELIDVAVTDRSGFLVGHIEDLVRTPSGHILRVRLRLSEGRIAWIEGSALRYYPDEKLLLVDLTPRQIWERSEPI